MQDDPPQINGKIDYVTDMGFALDGDYCNPVDC